MRKAAILLYALTISVGAFAQQAKEDFKKDRLMSASNYWPTPVRKRHRRLRRKATSRFTSATMAGMGRAISSARKTTTPLTSLWLRPTV